MGWESRARGPEIAWAPWAPQESTAKLQKHTEWLFFGACCAVIQNLSVAKKHSTIARGTQNKLEKTHLGQTLKNRFRGTVKFSIPVFYQNQTISKPNLAYRPPLGT